MPEPPCRAGTPRDSLTREEIVRPTIELLDDEGLEGLNMRSLGKRLGTAATAVHWHVKNKDDLVLVAGDRVWNEIELPELGAADWRTPATALAAGLHAIHRLRRGTRADLRVRPPRAPRRSGGRARRPQSSGKHVEVEAAHPCGVHPLQYCCRCRPRPGAGLELVQRHHPDESPLPQDRAGPVQDREVDVRASRALQVTDQREVVDATPALMQHCHVEAAGPRSRLGPRSRTR
jgi:hypothetical protein